MLIPDLSILPASQRRLWLELVETPKHFVLYGGTALALRLGHRRSEDFDFFSNRSFQPGELLAVVPHLEGSELSQSEKNTLTALVDRNGPVKVSFFGALKINRVHEPDVATENGIQVASMLDLLASKLKTVQLRAEAKDYRYIAAALDAGLSLADGLAAAAAIYGKQFNGVLSLKALTFFEDGDLSSLPLTQQKQLLKAATSVDMRKLPTMTAKPGVSQSQEAS